MTIPVAPSKARRGPNGEYGVPQSDSSKARLFLGIACIWPFILLALFASSAPHVDTNVPAPTSAAVANNLRLNFRNVLDRVDIMGYGPTHPRVAAVVVGDDRDNLVSTVESVFSKTDMNRIFVVCVVVDGHEEDMSLVRDLIKIDSGAIPHWHGERPDLHVPGDKEPDDENPHGRKVHVLFNKKKKGVTASRADGVEFIQILEKLHEEAGLKSPEEDLILLLLQGGTQIASRRWLSPVTEALIVPPPILGKDDTMVAMKLANAVSFNLEGAGKRTSFDSTFTPTISEPSAEELNLSSGASYPAPALNGAAVAMRLDTHINLPSQDMSLSAPWPANLDLTLNLWLCGDGIDVLKDVEVTSFEQNPPAPLAPDIAARFAAAWMDDVSSKKFFNAYTKTYQELTYLEWETFMSNARESPTFTKDLSQRCRSFKWYAEEINHDLSDVLEKAEEKYTGGKDKKNLDPRKPDELLPDLPKKPLSPPKVNEADHPDLPEKPLAPPKVDENEQESNGDDFKIPERKDKAKPSKSLCPECLEIVQKAKPVDLTYVDVSEGHKEHPHMGAKDENGNSGYVHDATALRKNPPPYNFSGDALQKACTKRDNNYKMLHEKVFVDMEAHEKAEKSGKKRDKIFCLVYTTEKGHPAIPRIRETWG